MQALDVKAEKDGIFWGFKFSFEAGGVIEEGVNFVYIKRVIFIVAKDGVEGGGAVKIFVQVKFI